jgi:hypothetical protein
MPESRDPQLDPATDRLLGPHRSTAPSQQLDVVLSKATGIDPETGAPTVPAP